MFIIQLNLAQKQSGFKTLKGFTLAEVLITLGIIGVVAAMTIPTLLNNVNDKELQTAWRKEYSAFSQTISKMTLENGGDLNGIMTNSWDALYDALAANLNVAHKSKFGDGDWSNYDPKTGTVSTTYTKKLNGQTGLPWWWCTSNGGRMMLQDGSFVWVLASGTASSTAIHFDVNGYKGPNTVGRDIFGVTLTSDGKITPYGTGTAMQTDANSGCDKSLPNTDGAYCAAYYLTH